MDYQNTTTYEDWLPETLLAVRLHHLHVVVLTKKTILGTKISHVYGSQDVG